MSKKEIVINLIVLVLTTAFVLTYALTTEL